MTALVLSFAPLTAVVVSNHPTEQAKPSVVALKASKPKVVKKAPKKVAKPVSRTKVRTQTYIPPAPEKPRVSRSGCAWNKPKPCGRNQRTGYALASARGWDGEQWLCLKKLWYKESGWSIHSTNASGTAGGIPQALPASKMASAGDDWKTNPATQIKWGLGYIANRYGSPCGAWSHFQSHNWY